MNPAAWLWLALLGIFTVIEAATVSLVSIWFIGGAAVAFVMALFNLPLWSQCLAFAVVSAALLLCLRPFIKKHVDANKISTNVDALIGSRAIVTEAIDNLRAEGAIRVGGSEWTARSTDDSPIAAETVVIIRKVEGVKAFVEPEQH